MGVGSMKSYAIAIGALAVVVLTTLAVVSGFKDTNLVDNATADKFVTGLTIFATFVGVVILALVGKVIVSLYKGS